MAGVRGRKTVKLNTERELPIAAETMTLNLAIISLWKKLQRAKSREN